jgi:hypothetical protein
MADDLTNLLGREHNTFACNAEASYLEQETMRPAPERYD